MKIKLWIWAGMKGAYHKKKMFAKKKISIRKCFCRNSYIVVCAADIKSFWRRKLKLSAQIHSKLKSKRQITRKLAPITNPTVVSTILPEQCANKHESTALFFVQCICNEHCTNKWILKMPIRKKAKWISRFLVAWFEFGFGFFFPFVRLFFGKIHGLGLEVLKCCPRYLFVNNIQNVVCISAKICIWLIV